MAAGLAGALDREKKRSDGALTDMWRGWRATATQDRRLWFHPADFPIIARHSGDTRTTEACKPQRTL